MHTFESARLPYFQQMGVPSEFAEVASMGMELIAGPYLARSEGGFYSKTETGRARAEHLEGIITFWPYMAVVDAFQHWVYENPADAADPACCDSAWSGLWRRFMPGVDWNGLEDEMATGWHRKLHIHVAPFYYIEYGLAQLGAAQVWAGSLRDAPSAVAAYRRALALGGTAPLPALYEAAGARLAFDAETLAQSIGLLERTLDELE
jgi:oligoendopeptidase F